MRFRFAVLLLAAAVAASFAGACSNQGEGQVCDSRAGNNGNDDCQDGLTCQLRPGVNGYRCCPPANGPAPTTPECTTPPSIADASPAPPDGTTPMFDAAGDAPSEAAARGDATADAPADAPADAGATSDASDAAGQ